jgi:hypothetical protein
MVGDFGRKLSGEQVMFPRSDERGSIEASPQKDCRSPRAMFIRSNEIGGDDNSDSIDRRALSALFVSQALSPTHWREVSATGRDMKRWDGLCFDGCRLFDFLAIHMFSHLVETGERDSKTGTVERPSRVKFHPLRH